LFRSVRKVFPSPLNKRASPLAPIFAKRKVSEEVANDDEKRHLLNSRFVAMLRKAVNFIRQQGVNQALEELRDDGHNPDNIELGERWFRPDDDGNGATGAWEHYRSEDER